MANDHHSDPHDPLGRPKRDRSWRFYLAMVIGILALILIVQNSEEVEFRFFFLEGTTPVFFGLIIAFLAGALVGWLLPRVRGRHRRSEDD